jgi:anti-anti-sigma factor
MDLTVEQFDNNRILARCAGELSWAERETLAEQVAEHFAPSPPPAVVLDLRGVTHANSAGVGALFQLVQRIHAADGRLVLTNLSPVLQRLFVTVGLDRVAPIEATPQKAWDRLAREGTVDQSTEDR